MAEHQSNDDHSFPAIEDAVHSRIKASASSVCDLISTTGEVMESFSIRGGFILKIAGKLCKTALESNTPSLVDKVEEVSYEVSSMKENVDHLTQGVDTIIERGNKQAQTVDCLTQGINKMKNEVGQHTQRLDRIKDKMDQQAQSVDTIKTNVDYVNQGVDTIVEKVDQNTQSVDKINDKMDQLAVSVDTTNKIVDDLRLELSDWLKEQKKIEQERAKQKLIEDVGNVVITIVKSMEKFNSGDPLDITRGVLDIISSAAPLISNTYSPIIGIVCGLISAILTESQPQQPSVLDQLAGVVHDELVGFNKRLQDQKYNGLKRRVSDQLYQLRTMKLGEKLDDYNLWNDYAQFMGELSNRFESPLPFKYEDHLTDDPDVADFVTAVVSYCEAYCCFMGLLIAAKGKFAELGSAYEEDEGAVDRKIRCQMEDARKKLSFLSEEKYLTFLGRLPYEGGKLTKIVALSRNIRGKSLVEEIIGKYMPDLVTVKEAATKVVRQSVKARVEGHHLLFEKWWEQFWVRYYIQFINETTFPMRIVAGGVSCCKNNLKFVQDVYPRLSYHQSIGSVFPRGYIIIYLDGILSSDMEPPATNTRIIEFALSSYNINIQDKTSDEFNYGKDTYNKMKCGEAKTLYWFEKERHFMARGEIVPLGYLKYVWRFVVQDFDPCSEQDIIMG